MEAFSLLKYWRGGGATRDGGSDSRAATTTIATAVTHHAAETDDDDTDDGDDDGPFFDLEFAVPDEDDGDKQEKSEEDNAECEKCLDDDGDEERGEEDIESDGTSDGENEAELNFTLSSGSSGDCTTDQNVSLSPSDDLFFKGRLVPIEPSSFVFNGTEPNAKSQFSLLKSATKFRVLMLKFKKSKAANVTDKTEPDGSSSATAKHQPKQEEPQKQEEQNHQSQSKLFTVKFKVEDVPIMSLFTRENSSRASSGGNKSQKQQSSDESASDEKRFSKDVMQKYLKMVKPLYIRVSKRHGEKLGFSGQLSSGAIKAGPSSTSSEAQKSPPSKVSAAKGESEEAEVTELPPVLPPPGNEKVQKQGNLPARLRVVCKHLGKSRSASSAVAAAPSGSSSIQTRRRDDSLLQQQDGIQSAILHCKRSFNGSRGESI
ncbi:hypothetical protein U1Q18_019698 [Sarracenia purpurea var. burkii]